MTQQAQDFDSTLQPLAEADGTAEHAANLGQDEPPPYPAKLRRDTGDEPGTDMGDEPEVMV